MSAANDRAPKKEQHPSAEPLRFSGRFTAQEPIPETALDAVRSLLESGRLHRYGAGDSGETQTARLEAEYRDWQGSRYCLALASCGQAMQIALRAAGVAPGDPVLMNAFTLAPAPGAVAAVGARPVLVEIDESLTIDLADLARKAAESGARFLLASHMRGHLADMDRLQEIVDRAGLTMIEDCAHTMGARWNGVRSGNFGLAGCFSTQSYKHMNSGEGGLLTSDDPAFMARATILSGSYMYYASHGAGPDAAHFADARLDMPNCSARMDELRAAILRPQIPLIEPRVAHWATLHDALAEKLGAVEGLAMSERSPLETVAASSLQFRLPGVGADACRALCAQAAERGVVLKWFGDDAPVGFTSNHHSWRYVAPAQLPNTTRILATLFDLRLSPTFTVDDCIACGQILVEEIQRLSTQAARE